MTGCPAGRFCSPVDFNAQLADWLAVVNTRAWRALRSAPVDRIAADTGRDAHPAAGRCADRARAPGGRLRW
jgi:hypothetical protein